MIVATQECLTPKHRVRLFGLMSIQGAAQQQYRLFDMETFSDSFHCQRQTHCPTCRWDSEEGRKWRESIAKYYSVPSIDFECPEGKPWEKELKQPVAPAKKGPKQRALRAVSEGIGRVAGGPKLTDEQIQERITICRSGCELLIQDEGGDWCGELLRLRFGAESKRRKGCGCLLDVKRLYRDFDCPRGLWPIKSGDHGDSLAPSRPKTTTPAQEARE